MYSQRKNEKKEVKISSPKEITTVYTLSKQIRQTAPIVAMAVKTMTAIVRVLINDVARRGRKTHTHLSTEMIMVMQAPRASVKARVYDYIHHESKRWMITPPLALSPLPLFEQSRKPLCKPHNFAVCQPRSPRLEVRPEERSRQ